MSNIDNIFFKYFCEFYDLLHTRNIIFTTTLFFHQKSLLLELLFSRLLFCFFSLHCF